eukprot:scaffold11961_cov20-Tisochrysis_lutea.AAC.2
MLDATGPVKDEGRSFGAPKHGAIEDAFISSHDAKLKEQGKGQAEVDAGADEQLIIGTTELMDKKAFSSIVEPGVKALTDSAHMLQAKGKQHLPPLGRGSPRLIDMIEANDCHAPTVFHDHCCTLFGLFGWAGKPHIF